jgi:methyl-accepting chemotaxis protein
VERAARELAAFGTFQEWGEGGAVTGIALLDPTGRPVALALVAHDGSEALPLIRRQAALLSSMLSILGLMCAVGVVAAVLMGALAPRLVWRDIRTSTDFIFRSVDRLRELVQRNQGALDEQSRLTRSLLASVASLEAASKDILRTAGALAHTAEQSAWVSQTGNQKAELAQRSVLEVRERVMDLSSQMEELGRRCDEIGSLTSFINHLSSETNALSINATIQAAGSGGNGRQFTVMAGEIQRLADLSQDSTRDINHLVERIQEASRTTLGASKEGCERVDRAKACCEELEAAFARILRWVEETTQAAHGIEHSTEEQAGSLQQVGQAIEQLEQRSRYTTGNFQDIVLAADELAGLGSEMNEKWKVG